METPLALGLAVAAAFFGALGSYVLSRVQMKAQLRRAEAAATDEASRILRHSREEADRLLKAAELQGKEDVIRVRETWQAEEDKRREELERAERRVEERASALDRQLQMFADREQGLADRSAELASRESDIARANREVKELEQAAQQRLEQLAGIAAADAKALLMEQLQAEAEAEAANTLRTIQEEAERTAGREAKKILALSIQRMAADVTGEMTVSVVQLPSDDMKGRIIGREGRNIRSFEQATGIDVIIDDTPEAVILSGFDPVRREVARTALERLIEDGRIHPGRIEDVVAQARIDVESGMVQAAEELLYELGVHGVNQEIARALGRLRFRTSYGQNQMQHAREVALLAGNMAAELKLDVELTKRAGVLHDVGKGLTHEHEGTHVELGYRLCKKHGEPPIVLNAIRAHHDEEPHFFAETFLVSAADAISGSRPGARRAMFETYVKRLEQLEEVAMSLEGVERCFAIQAGRELRVMVEPDKVSDSHMAQISEEVAQRIQNELQYPGQIKVVVIRETRAVDFAR